MPKQLKCKCKGAINLKKKVTLQIGCCSSDIAHPCCNCGKLHWDDGRVVKNRKENTAFLIQGHVVHKDRRGKVVN